MIAAARSDAWAAVVAPTRKLPTVELVHPLLVDARIVPPLGVRLTPSLAVVVNIILLA